MQYIATSEDEREYIWEIADRGRSREDPRSCKGMRSDHMTTVIITYLIEVFVYRKDKSNKIGSKENA